MKVLTPTTRELMIEKAEEWLADGETFIGVFENKDLGHPELGHRIMLPYEDALFEAAILGKTTPPDMPYIGLGWRYLMVCKTRSSESAVCSLMDGKHDEDSKDRG